MEFKQLITSNHQSSKTVCRKKYVTKIQRANYIKQWEESHLTQQAFCKQQGLNSQTFYQWLKKSKEMKKEKISETLSFPNTQLAPCSDLSATVELQLPKGIIIILKGDHHHDLLIRLIKGFISCNCN